MKNKKRLILIASIILVLTGAVYIFIYTNNARQTTTVVSDNPNDPTFNLDPATEQEQQSADDNKQSIVDKDKASTPQTNPDGSSKKSVKPVITYAGQYDGVVEVGAYADVFEKDGSCTATFTNGTSSFQKTTNATQNAKSTDCAVLSANSSEFSPKGTWTVVVEYVSATTYGKSDGRSIEVK